MLTGFSILYLGVDLKVSLLYKTPLFFLLLVLTFRLNPIRVLVFSALLLFSLSGPLYTVFTTGEAEYFAQDIISLIKLYTPFLVLLFLIELMKVDFQLCYKKTQQALEYAFYLMLGNFMLGAAGVGKSTYQVSEEDGAGSTGLIMAGNEVGAAFLVVFGYKLFKTWNNGSALTYLFYSLLTIACGFIVSTKTTMLASLLLVFLVPIISERDKLFKITSLKFKMFTPLISIVSVAIYLIVDLLQSLGLWGRIQWFYEKKGIIGIVLSGRDEMVLERLGTYIYNMDMFTQIFGMGQRVAKYEIYEKASTEIDSVDILTFYGVFTLLIIAFFYIYNVIFAFKKGLNKHSIDSAGVFLISFILLLLSQISGHIWTSGTLGIIFAVLMSRAYFESLGINNERHLP
ncbi:hypothetical protein [Pseudoalteromonas gelatinilytica]